jgi:hypothetical protein
MRIALGAALLALATGWASPAASQVSPRLLRGRDVVFRLTEPRATLKGELLAITVDSAWVLARSGDSVVAVANPRIEGGWYRRHGFDAGKAGLWGAVVGVVSGGALTAACSSVAEDCGGVFVAVSISSVALGGLAALTTGSSKGRFVGAQPQLLAPFARFPQGRPLGLRWADLRGGSGKAKPPGPSP